MNNYYDFAERLTFSQGQVADTSENTIRQMLSGCVSVDKTDVATDKTGIDYIARLRRGGEVFIDHKARERGCSRYWKRGEELALEMWSVKPEKGRHGVAGWTLDEAKRTHYTLHTFDPSDSQQAYLLPFQLLRVTFRRQYGEWTATFPTATQSSGKWRSECVFVPASVVLDHLRITMCGNAIANL